ncbi:MAG: restriction endonuclease subunit S [Opitutales bacterium]|nr:restriction endonuclease subunit S [Opitutales bacterium]
MKAISINDGWIDTRFDECTQIANGQVSPLDDDFKNLPHIGPENIERESGRIHGVQTARELGLQSGKYYFDENALVYSKIRPNLNKVCRPQFKGICSADAYPIWAKENVDIKYLHHFMLSPAFLSQAIVVSLRTGMPKINRADLNKIRIPLPPLPEQKKIAEILGACDEAIEAQERLIALKQQRKKGLMQQLLTGKTRFPQFAGKPWREVKIDSLLREVKRPVEWNDSERYQLLSLRRRSGGPFARESLLGSQIKTKTLKKVHAGDFLIAKMQVTHGALGMVTRDFDGWKVSDSYICLVPRNPESFDIRFFNYLSQNRYIWHLAYVSSYGVAIEKMTFVLKHFMKKEIRIPPTKEETSTIADCLDAANEEITLQQQKLEQLKQQKKALMQQLLTGKVRVKV